MTSPARLGRLIRGAAFWSVSGTALGQIVSFGSLLVMIRYVSPADYAAVAIGIVLVEILKATFIESIGRALTATPRPTNRDYSLWLWRAVIISAALAAATGLLATPVAALTGNSRLEPVLQVTALLLLLSGLTTVPVARLSQSFRFRAIAVSLVAASLVGGAVGIAMAASGFGLWSLLAQQLAVSSALCVLLWVVGGWLPSAEARSGGSPSPGTVVHVGTTGALEEIDSRIDFMIVAAAFSPHAAGLYGLAKRVMGAACYLAVTPIERILLPFFARTELSRGAAVPKRLLASLRIGNSLLGLGVLQIVVVLPLLVQVVLRSDWGGAASLVAALGAAPYFRSTFSYSTAVILTSGRADLQKRLMLLSAALNILVVACASQLELVWVAAGFTAASAVAAAIAMIAAEWVLKLPALSCLRAVAPSLTALCAASGAAWLLLALGGADISFPVGAGVGLAANALYLLLLWRLDRPTMTLIAAHVLPRGAGGGKRSGDSLDTSAGR